MQKLMELEEKINYLISLQQPKIQDLPKFSFDDFSQQPKMPDFQYKERMFPTGIEHQRFGAFTRGNNKS